VKDGSLLDDDFMAGQLPRGATGPQGPAGAGGATGPPGVQGLPGRSALTTLQPGETVRGFVGGDFEQPGPGTGDWRVSASFPIPATSPPGNFGIDGVSTGESCTGTMDNPTAPPGTLCVYPNAANNPVLAPDSHFIGDINRFGFTVVWIAGPGDTYFNGTYAMTQG
jgi:hypothetical protein